MERPIFLLGAHKSGSSLLRALFDGHPDLFVVPFEAHFFESAHYWVDYQLRATRPPQLPLETVKAEFIEVARRYNTHRDPTADAYLAGRLDLDALAAALDRETASLADTLSAYVQAIYASLYHSQLPPGARVAEKSVENAEFALDLKRMFPDAMFVHIVRNPYANLVSLRRKAKRWRFPFLGRYLRAMQNSHYWLYRNQRMLDDYQVIRYEDLLAEPEETMRAVAESLGLAFDAILLQPTSLGVPWEGNSSRGIQFAGVATRNRDLWRGEITALEVYYITRFFRFVLDDFEYEVLEPARSRFWPIWREDPLTYLANRTISPYL